MNSILEQLKNKRLVWQANQHQASATHRHTGYPELDDMLQGGFPNQGVVDIQSPIGIGELRLLLPALRERQQQGERLLVFIAPPMQINAEMLAYDGLDLANILVIQPISASHALWSAEQCLKSGVCHSVLLWHGSLEVAQVKRLQLAAEQGQALHFVFRRNASLQLSLPVSLAIKLNPAKQGLDVHITKRKGGWPSPLFSVSMARHWPALTLQDNTDNVIAFPRKAS